MTDPLAATARRLWRLIEPVHACVYFAAEARDVYAAAGLRGGWMGYFASRSAAMGAVGADVVIATFHNFQPAMVRRAIPDAWGFASPARVLEARLEVADRALRRLLGDAVADPGLGAVAGLAAAAAEAAAADSGGRPLCAGHAGLALPGAPHLALWHAATVLREHRFDGHVVALTHAGVDGAAAHLLRTGEHGAAADGLRGFRGFTEAEWAAAAERLRARGALDGAGALTAAGEELRSAVEATTDRLAAAPYRALGEERTASLAELLWPLCNPILEGVPFPNPIGMERPLPPP